MGYDLSNKLGSYFRFSPSGWDLALGIAQHYGWEPAGIPKPDDWDENEFGAWEDEYWINAGQEVEQDDALSLATALEQAVAAPDVIEIILKMHEEFTAIAGEAVPNSAQWIIEFSHADAAQFRDRLIEFARFVAQGPFVIE